MVGTPDGEQTDLGIWPMLFVSAQSAGLWLEQYLFETVEEAQDQATEWLSTCNNERPDMGIGGVTPAMKLSMAA